MDPTQAPAQTFSFGTILSDAWNAGLRTFNTWVDHELGAELALSAENQQAERRIALEQAPETPAPAPILGMTVFGVPVVAIAGAAAGLLLLFVLLRK